MADPVDGTGGSIGGMVSSHDRGAVTSFQGILKQWRFRQSMRFREAAGFGDAGDSYPAPGIASWTFGAVGEVETGANGTTGVNNMQGTARVTGTVQFQGESGIVWHGSARMTIVNVSNNYDSGACELVVQGIGYGPLAETRT